MKQAKAISVILRLMESEGVNQKEISARTGINKTNLSSILNGIRPLSPTKAFQILHRGIGLSKIETAKYVTEWEHGVSIRSVDAKSGFAQIPIHGFAECGPIDHSEHLGMSAIATDLIDENKEYFVFIANGISMQGKIEPGDRVLIESTDENIPDKIMLFSVKGKYGLGYLFREAGYYEVRKSNISFPPIPINSTEFKIHGAVKSVTNVNP